MLSLNDVKEYLGARLDASSQKIFVTPEQAKFLLKKCNKVNRRIKSNYVNTLKRDIESGHWYNDTDYIGFNRDGYLVNGQHRLKALSISNVKGIDLKFDFDAEQHISMDTGNNRSYGDQVKLSMKMEMEILPNKYKTIITSGLRLNNSKLSLSNSELLEIWKKYRRQLLECDENHLFDLGKITGSTVKSSLLWAFLSGVDMPTLSHIAEVLRTGIAKSDNDIPIIRLRDELVDLKGSGKDMDIRRAKYTQQCIYDVLRGSTSNRLPSNPILYYQNFNFEF